MSNEHVPNLDSVLGSEDRNKCFSSSRRCLSSTSERHINLFEIACLDLDASAERKIYQIAEEPDPESKNPQGNEDEMMTTTDKV